MTGDEWVGWSWACACGWSSHRHRMLEQVERSREGHLRWHRETQRPVLTGAAL